MTLATGGGCIYSWIKTIVKTACRPFSCNTSKSALLILADGAEELETVTIIDVLRRGSVQVTVAALTEGRPIKCYCKTKICPDMPLDYADGCFDAIVLPGGNDGAVALSKSRDVGKLLREQMEEGRIIAAICAAPAALRAHGIGYGRYITSYPTMQRELRDIYKYLDYYPVVRDSNLITSRGPGTALVFSLTILEALCGKEKALAVGKDMLYNYKSLKN